MIDDAERKTIEHLLLNCKQVEAAIIYSHITGCTPKQAFEELEKFRFWR